MCTPCNTCFLGLIWVHSTNSISTGSAIFAQLTPECRWGMPGQVLSPKNSPFAWGDLNAYFIHGYLSPQPKRQLDRFHRFYTAHSRKSLYFIMGRPFSPSKVPLSMGRSGHHLIHGSYSPREPITQTTSWSVHPFLQGSRLWQTDRPCYSVCNSGPYLRT